MLDIIKLLYGNIVLQFPPDISNYASTNTYKEIDFKRTTQNSFKKKVDPDQI